MREYIELGSAPYDEDCVQVTDKKDYLNDMKKEVRKYIELLEKKFINLPSGVSFSAKSFSHEFGTYYEAVVFYDSNNEEQTDVAYFIESNVPATWEDGTVIDVEKEIKNENLDDEKNCLTCGNELTKHEYENGHQTCDKCKDEYKKSEYELWKKTNASKSNKVGEKMKKFAEQIFYVVQMSIPGSDLWADIALNRPITTRYEAEQEMQKFKKLTEPSEYKFQIIERPTVDIYTIEDERVSKSAKKNRIIYRLSFKKMAKIDNYKPSSPQEIEEYELLFEDKKNSGSGYSFPCDKKGNVDESKLSPEALKNYKKCKENKDDMFYQPDIIDLSRTFKEPASGKCSCGKEVFLDSFTNSCDGCGKLYNMQGDELRPRDQWEEPWDSD